MVKLRLFKLCPAKDVVDDLKLGPRQPGCMQHPTEEAAGFVAVAEADQGLVRQSGIPQPAVAVIPVSIAADGLRKRGRRCSDDCTRVAVGEKLERYCAAQDHVAVGAAIGASRSPVPPPSDGLREAILCLASKQWQHRRIVSRIAEAEKPLLAFTDRGRPSET